MDKTTNKQKSIILVILVLLVIGVVACEMLYIISRRNNENWISYNSVDSDEEILLFTGYYGGYTTKEIANTIKGKCIDGYGNVYDYKIPCDKNKEMLIKIEDINKDIVEKYKGDIAFKLSKEDLNILLNNIDNVTDTYRDIDFNVIDAASSFVYIEKNGIKKVLLDYNEDKVRENSSEAAKAILDITARNNIIYLYD